MVCPRYPSAGGVLKYARSYQVGTECCVLLPDRSGAVLNYRRCLSPKGSTRFLSLGGSALRRLRE